jgi:hypothetical protein
MPAWTRLWITMNLSCFWESNQRRWQPRYRKEASGKVSSDSNRARWSEKGPNELKILILFSSSLLSHTLSIDLLCWFMVSPSMAVVNLSVPPKKSKPHWEHDVFLSFIGEDTRKNFIGHLYAGLMRVEVRTFWDDQGLQTRENIFYGLLKAICRSRISIVVFFKDYASSK